MRPQVVATAIAFGCLPLVPGCEWLYPSVSVVADEDSGADAPSGTHVGSGSGANGEDSSGSGSGGGASSGGSSGGSSGAGSGGSSGSSSGGSSGGSSGSSSGSSGSSSGGEVSPDGGSDADGGGATVAPIAFVQVASGDTNSDSVATISATYPNPQQAGDFDVVVVGWSDVTHTINAISDSAGNTFVLARAPSSAEDSALAIYYAGNIAGASSNTVTVDLDADDFLSVAVLEYSGVSAVDQTAEGTGTGDTASTSTVVTSVPRELVFGAGEPDQHNSTNFASAGAGFTERVITPISGMLAEDMIVSQTGSYNATGGLNGSTPWVMQVATFK